MQLITPSLISLITCCGSRRSFLSTSCATILVASPAITPAVIQDDSFPPPSSSSPSSASTSPSDLYLARPLGIAKDGSSGDNIRPSAPLEFLLPAARVGVYIYQSLSLAENLAKLKSTPKSEGANNDAERIIESLDKLLVTPPSFINSKDPTVTRGDPYNLPPLVGEIAAQQQKQKERKSRSIDVGLAPQFFEVGELMGERRAWNRIVRAEQARESASEVRRAFNIYTTNLNFNPTKYVYSGSKEEKKRLIREEKLPTAVDVIRSDLDARDLYRNAVQTALEDARAEFLYQQKVGFEDVSELVGLLRDARAAVDKWFSFVPDEDIQEALEVVRREQNTKAS